MHPFFLSVVLIFKDQAEDLPLILKTATTLLSPLVSDYELIVIDNGSLDNSISVLKNLTRPEGIPNLQVYSLAQEVDPDTAAWVGLENALGDYIIVADSIEHDLSQIPCMLDAISNDADVVFVSNRSKPTRSLSYSILHKGFNFMYHKINGLNLTLEAPRFRLVSKRVATFILNHQNPVASYRHLPATAGFNKLYLKYEKPWKDRPKNLIDCIDTGLRMLVSSTSNPMRLVSFLALAGASLNVVYSIYVVLVAIFKANVAPGWVTLSLQQSGMFFLLSLALLVMGEYILYFTSLSSNAPLYQVAQELTSAVISKKQKLNIEKTG